MPIVNAKMHPAKDKVVAIDPKLLVEVKIAKPENKTPAQKLEKQQNYGIYRCYSWCYLYC